MEKNQIKSNQIKSNQIKSKQQKNHLREQFHWFWNLIWQSCCESGTLSNCSNWLDAIGDEQNVCVWRKSATSLHFAQLINHFVQVGQAERHACVERRREFLENTSILSLTLNLFDVDVKRKHTHRRAARRSIEQTFQQFRNQFESTRMTVSNRSRRINEYNPLLLLLLFFFFGKNICIKLESWNNNKKRSC